MSQGQSRAATVAAARASIAHGSRSFAAASKLFAPAVRERAWLLYAWCRACDDLIDGQDGGGAMVRVAAPAERLARLRTLTAAALAGEPSPEPAFEGLRLVAAETAMPHAWPHALIDGFALDAAGWWPENEADLYRYCWHVAGVVGCMMAVVMGVGIDESDTLDRAADLGIAFQLANIARDIGEDAAAGRCYLPRDWLRAEGIPADAIMAPAHRPALARLAQRLADRAALFEASARVGAARLPLRSAWAVLAAAGIYGAIGREVARRGERAWDTRVTTSGAAKLGFVARAGWRAVVSSADAPRGDLPWWRPATSSDD